MRIRELEIKSFGKFKDKNIKVADGIHLFYGENESGKSTIHSFIRGMLFGIDRGRGRAAYNDTFSLYEPWENPGNYSGMLRFESGGKRFCIRRDFGRHSRRTELICEDDGEELSVENGDMAMLLGGMTPASYNNTISVGQLKIEPDRTLGAELRNFAMNYYAAGDGDIDLERALAQLKERKKQIEKEIKTELEEKQRQRERTEQEASYVWRDIHKLEDEMENLEAEIKSRREKEEKKDESKGVIDEIRPEKWRVHPVEILLFIMVSLFPMFVAPRPWNYLVCIIISLCCVIYVWNRLKVGKKQEKTEPERLLEEIMPEEEKASLEKLIWERNRISEEVRDKKTVYGNLKEQIEELEELGGAFEAQEKRRAAIELAICRINELSDELQDQMGRVLNERVSEIIRSITAGRYSRLVVEDQMQVSLISGGRKISMDRVSRGTIEQIQFALRMAAAEILYEEELPVFLDDTFIYYDDNRLANTLEWLWKNKKQVLIFTCQKREEQVLKRLGIPYIKEEVC